ncbi:uncharacterized protein BJ171DRAFT_497302 [Polychytrium aggregatum]|uniref:uncharacterized protein n=1 Tax=Polychytrium aggregatum TaxID=110093 RepID=UPI0022FE2233|nr:uncharacterized protein BJ171DRAFT_497302 [Polychytrium aggregatum]KAI9206343.1 hypothetical protein BJ171DRAFT_497302 [Polychytrium aggregatum]
MASFRFCSECNNMLYPKEDHHNRILLFACRNCNHEEGGDNPCVYRHVLSNTAMDLTMQHADLYNDPTYPRANKTCPQCGYNQAVFFMSRAKRADVSMKLYFACCSPDCGHRWTDVTGGAK